MSIYVKFSEKYFVIFSLVFFTGGFIPHIPQGNPISQLIPILPFIIQTIVTILIILRWKKVLRLVIKEKLLWILMAIVIASALASDQPMLAFYRPENFHGLAFGVIPLLQVTLFGVYFAARYSLKEQLEILAWVFGIVAMSSLVVGAVLPRYGVMGMGNVITIEDFVHTGAWRGIFIHKQVLGITMLISVLVFLFFTASNSRTERWIGWTGFSISVGLILLTNGKSALVILLTLLILIPPYRALRWNYKLVLPFFITIVLLGGGLATLLTANLESILTALGKDATLSGRTEFWPSILEKIWERPWLGYGYGVFWRGWEGPSADIWYMNRIKPTHAHNGFFNIALSFGLLGLAVFLLSYLTACLQAVSWIRLTKTAEGLAPLLYLTSIVLPNITETFLMQEDIFWILYVTTVLSMHNKRVNLLESQGFWQDKEIRVSLGREARI